MFRSNLMLMAGTIILSVSSLSGVARANPDDSTTQSEPLPPPIVYESIPDLFQQAISYESGTYFSNRSTQVQLQLILGTSETGRSGFPENQLTRDTQLVHILYEDYLRQQAGEDQIRTRDLENPYSTSLGTGDF